MKRRILLSLPALWCCNARSAEPHRTVLGLFQDPARAQAIGRAYLATMGCQPDAATLPRLSGYGSMRTQIRAQCSKDFIEGRVVSIDGWLLAVTEVRLCAWVAMNGDPQA